MGRKKLKPFSAELSILDAASDGRAVARKDDRVVFVKYGVPGDVMDVEVYKREKKALVGSIKRLIHPSEDRVEPQCQHFGECGGCKWQMMAYPAQLRFKQKQVYDSFERIAKVDIGERLPILGVKDPYHYRNKLEFTFANRAWLSKEEIANGVEVDQRVLGFHAPGFYDKILNIATCYLFDPKVDEVRNGIRTFVREQGISFYDVKAHTGYLRNLIFRNTYATQEWMLVLVVGEDKPDWLKAIFSYVEAQFPFIQNLIWIHNTKLNSSYSDLPFHIWKGSGYITEHLAGCKYQISPTSFFQTNPRQAENLYGVVKTWMKELLPAGTDKFDCVYDLYTGTGSIAIFVSDLVRKIVGIEYVESSIADARKNIALNETETLFRFYAGDMKKILTEELILAEGRPELVITDPPRQGMEPKVVKRLLEMAPDYILYVSCKPATQARDVSLLASAYNTLRIQPVDMFPQTAHVENIALLQHKRLVKS